MRLSLQPAIKGGRQYAFPFAWLAVFAAGVGLRQPVPVIDASSLLGFSSLGPVSAAAAAIPPMNADTAALIFVRHDLIEADDPSHYNARDIAGGHGRFAAPGNAVRRQVQLRAISPRTADELAGFFRDVSYTLTDIRQGVAVPPIKLERVPDDLGSKDGSERKLLFITALLPVVLEVNQRVLAEREQLLQLRDRVIAEGFDGLSLFDRAWLHQLADRYDVPTDPLDQGAIDKLMHRVDIVPPSMAIAQSGIESGWGTSFAARTGNALFGQIQAVGQHAVSVSWKPGAGMPQPFANVGEAAEAYVGNLNSHPAYAAFRAERAAMRERGETPDGYQLIGQLLRYSERGAGYVQFVRQVMREDQLTDFDKARLSGF
jgi:Bax protein